MLRICYTCKLEKDTNNEFHIARKEKDGRSFECKECVRKYNASYGVGYYYNGGAKERRYLARDFINWIATEQGCIDCNDRYKDMPEFLKIINERFLQHPETLTYDHVRGEKKFVISMWSGYSLKSSLKKQKTVMKRFQEELKKCEIVCANCHHIRTKKDWYKYNQVTIDKRAIEREKVINA